MKRIWIGFGVVSLLFFVIFGYFYFYGGLKYYFRARRVINNLSGEIKEQAVSEFSLNPSENGYRGIVGVITTWGYGGVLVWGMDGPRYFRADEGSVFLAFKGCDKNSPELASDNESMGIEKRSIPVTPFANITEWKKELKPGDFVNLSLSSDENGEVSRRVRNIWSNDWWYFVPGTMEVQCAK